MSLANRSKKDLWMNELPALMDRLRQLLLAEGARMTGREAMSKHSLVYAMFTECNRVSTGRIAEGLMVRMFLRDCKNLYGQLQSLITEHLGQVRENIARLSEDEFLAALSASWNHFKYCNLIIHGIFEYLNRVYVKIANLDNIKDLGIRIFRDNIVYHEEIRNKVRNNMMDKRRQGAAADADQVRSAYEMLMDLGQETIDVYLEICEHPFVARYIQLLSSVQNMGNQEVCLYGRKHCRYNFHGLLGNGAFGNVFSAKTTDGAVEPLMSSVAVKVFPLRADMEDTAAWISWCRRLRILSELSHLNLVRYHKIAVVSASSERQVQIVMHLCDGGDLSKLLKQYRNNDSRLELQAAISYATEIADGLSFLHYNNIIHGDLKPSNVLVHSNRLVIGDLDGSIPMQRYISCAADAENLYGSLHYMAPEVLRKVLTLPIDQILGRKVDIWSFGCIILDLAEGIIGESNRYLCKMDQDGTDLKIIGANMTTWAYAKLLLEEGYSMYVDPAVPTRLAECIAKCLLVKPETRSSAHEMLNLLKTEPCANSVG
ncbi:serine/threonine-protein kinase Sgk3-like [Paramacrobiotus metropolitanus]|uniref:serine/threonine-protein kinase Sgk3-like n=1 Tax=Paramacrobiotus metropolitanus TaxID=2943436 RepID=UPI0024461D7B|nr:serine/threonine-protein kinase Sgk3-like [Paramacrobiotus metropolitanus]XP_055347201.1 serine/threonine-protein kinase Sgk3-like [Paramacrobiotus metropolitanus]XP_055347202.1 serine/threonine-protein kinase Sgk3-like [Paramacrobiotus metropolitanus]XP_055347203.1 serine/threonine-protein kinase Sgk3-like [Paramacrobiotus metropolitanus]